MFRLLNFKWDGSHRVRPSCDNFRSKLLETDQAKSKSSQEKAIEAITTHGLGDQEDESIAKLEAFISKMGQYQAHMKQLEERNELLAAQNAQYKEENFKLKAKHALSRLPPPDENNNKTYTAFSTVSLPSFPQQNSRPSPNEAVI